MTAVCTVFVGDVVRLSKWGTKHFTEVVLEFVSANPLSLPSGSVLAFSTSIKSRLLRDSYSRSHKQLLGIQEAVFIFYISYYLQTQSAQW